MELVIKSQSPLLLMALVCRISCETDTFSANTVNALSKKVDYLVKNLGNHERKFEELERALVEKEQRIYSLSVKLRRKDLAMKELMDRILQQDDKTNQLKNGLLENREETDQLKTKISGCDIKVDILNAKVKQLNMEVEGFRRNLLPCDDARKVHERSSANTHKPVENDDRPMSWTEDVNKDDIAVRKARNRTLDDKSNQNRRSLIASPSRRSRLGEVGSSVAFYAYMSSNEPQSSRHHTVVFDHVVTNAGNGYNGFAGTFTAPSSGIYYFTWTIYAYCHSFIYTEIVKNNIVYGSSLADSDEICDNANSVGNAITTLQNGDVVFIRTSSSYESRGDIRSESRFRSSFAGFLIY